MKYDLELLMSDAAGEQVRLPWAEVRSSDDEGAGTEQPHPLFAQTVVKASVWSRPWLEGKNGEPATQVTHSSYKKLDGKEA